MEYMVYIKIVDVLAGDNINLFIPFFIQWLKFLNLSTLECSEVRKIMENDFSGLQAGYR